MYPDLHAQVALRLMEDKLHFDFHDVDSPTPGTREYDTNVMGKFRCHNTRCASNGWSSKQIPITIRMYPDKRKYNARVYHQRCQHCKQPSRPSLDQDSYAERIAYRLKKWSGIKMVPPTYSGESKGPHHSHLCEGCKAGHCREGF